MEGLRDQELSPHVFWEGDRVGLTECSLVSFPVRPGPGALLRQAGLPCLPLDPLSSGLPSEKSGLADGPLPAPSASCSLKELAEEARFCAKPLESSLASVIEENDAIGKRMLGAVSSG